MKIRILADMEGVSGIRMMEQVKREHPEHYGPARVLMMREINAAIEAAFDAGATTMVACDTHGRVVGEIGIEAAYAAHFSVPVIAVSGDEATAAEARELPGDVECAVVNRPAQARRGRAAHRRRNSGSCLWSALAPRRSKCLAMGQKIRPLSTQLSGTPRQMNLGANNNRKSVSLLGSMGETSQLVHVRTDSTAWCRNEPQWVAPSSK